MVIADARLEAGLCAEFADGRAADTEPGGKIDKDFYIVRLREASEIVVWAWRVWACTGQIDELRRGERGS